MSDLIKINSLEVEFHLHGQIVKAVKGVSFRIPAEKTVALVGESGSGKSVIARSIMGILPKSARITAGEIMFNDPEGDGNVIDLASVPVDGAQMRQIRGGRISIIFQEPMTSLSQLHTVGDQISEALHLHRDISPSAGLEVVETMLRTAGFPDPKKAMKSYPFELSGGLNQRAMIAMALVCQPALLIADEPTTALDVSIQAVILKLIRDMQAELGMAVLMITHDLGIVANVADEVVVLYHGKLMESGPVEDIFQKPEHPYLQALLGAIPHFDMKPGERLTPIREISHQSGPLIGGDDSDTGPSAVAKGAPLLTLSGLTKTFTSRKQNLFASGPPTHTKAVAGLDLEIRKGECLGLVGESGCGKSSVSKMIMRAITPDEGTITLHDRDSDTDVLALDGNALTDYRKRVQMIFQDPVKSLNPRMTVFDIIREPLAIHGIGTRRQQADLVQKLMQFVGLDTRFLNRYPHSFSGGQRQRIGLARALALKPDLLICDEPVSALDVSIQAQVLNLFKDLQKDLDLTYLFISHNLAVVDYVSDRIAVMSAGRIVEIAPREVLFRNPAHHYTRLLMAAVPYPDLDRKLDFDLFKGSGTSGPADWPAPYTIRSDQPMAQLDLGEGHYVLTAPGTQPEALFP